MAASVAVAVVLGVFATMHWWPVLAATISWDLSVPGSYSYDAATVDVTGGLGKLKAIGNPGTDWFANDGSGNHWGWQKPITINNTGNTSTLTNYPVQLTLDTAALVASGKLLENCNDLRFTDSDKSTVLSYWIHQGCNTTTTEVWVKIPSIPASSNATIYLYYGNSAAAAASNGSAVFSLFDDFSGASVDATKWAVVDPHGNEVSESGGKLHMATGNGQVNWDTHVYAKQSFPRGAYSFEWDHTTTSTYSPYNAFMYGWAVDGVANSATYTSLVYGYYRQGDPGTCINNNISCSMSAYEKGGGIGAFASRTDAGTQYALRVRMKPAAGAYYELSTNGGLSYTTDYSSTAYNDTNLHPDWELYSGDHLIDNARVRPWTSPEPTGSAGSEAALYPTTNPTITPNAGQGYSSISAFTETQGAGSTGAIQYQISPDNGGSWYWWNGSAWATAAGYAQSNSAAAINSHVATFSAGSNPKSFAWKAFLHSDGNQLPMLDQIGLTYVWDTQAPDNPATVTATSANGGGPISQNVWYNYATPYFTWSTPADNANTGGGEVPSGVAGYYVYFGTDNTANPTTAGAFQTGAAFTASGLSSGQTYYLRLATKDNAGNTNASPVTRFSYQFDSTPPTNPAYVSASPAGYSATDSFSFLWPAGVDTMAGLDPTSGYCYKTGAAGATDTCVANTLTLISGIHSYQSGTNIFYLRAKDAAGNINPSYVQVTYYYNPDAPNAPVNLTVTPTTNTKNEFAFSWTAPSAPNGGSIAGYRYSINAKPTVNNTQATSSASLPAGPYATQVGENTFYVVAVSDTGVVNYDNPASVAFSAETAAPPAPLNTSVTDASNRTAQLYALTVSWKAPDPLPPDFSGYVVERALSDVSAASFHAASDLAYAPVAKVTDTAYTNTSLDSSKTYFYRVRSVDSTSNASAPSTIVSKTPTGKFTDPPAITKGPSIEAKSTSAVITWTTDRAGTSLVQCGPTTSYGISAGQLDAVTDHSVDVKGLTPGASYHCRAQTTDVPELVDYSTTAKGFSPDVIFKTLDAPGITDITVSNISLSGAIISWKTNVVATSTLVYGPSLSYGLSVNDQSSSSTTNHAVLVKGLKDSTAYHFRIKSVDSEGNLLQSDDYVFETLKMPVASNIQFQPIKNQPTATMKITWDTNVPTTSVVTYSGPGVASTETSKAALETKHDVTITNLVDDTEYTMTPGGRDGFGNTVIGAAQHFHTATDSRPPVISDITVEAQTQGTSDQAKAQLVVSWNTDEPSSAQIEYGPGLSSDSYPNQTVEDSAYSGSHVVVVSELKPASTYHLRVKSHDKSGNMTASGDHVVITGRASSSVLNIIIQNLQRSFGWLGALGK